MDEATKKDILERAKSWMRDELIPAHKVNTLKLASLDEFNINPFIWPYLAFFLEGNRDYTSLAKALVYPRALGSSISTSFGQRAQRLIVRLFEDSAFGSGIKGIDIEFIDKIDNRRKYAQVKAGPNVVNRDDVETVGRGFETLKNKARLDGLELRTTDMMFCLLYGEADQKNGFVREIERNYVVSMGEDFWHRFTGDKNFYKDLIAVFAEVATEVNMKKEIGAVVQKLAKSIKKEYGELV